MRIAVTGAGGFIGGHLVKRLIDQGHTVMGVDIKPVAEWWQLHPGTMLGSWDLRKIEAHAHLFHGRDQVYHLAADMGGRGFTGTHDADCSMNAMLDANVLRMCIDGRVKRLFYASTACVYNTQLQTPDGPARALKEEDVYPYNADDVYGWAKLYGEFAAKAYGRDYRLEVRIGRYHCQYGPSGTWTGGREKAPAALIRKALESKQTGQPIEVWGDGTQRRSFMYVDDCVDATMALMASDCCQPLNIGSDEVVTIAELAGLCASLAGSDAGLKCVPGIVGPHSRNSDNTRIRDMLGWEPKISLEQGLALTMPWIAEQMDAPCPV